MAKKRTTKTVEETPQFRQTEFIKRHKIDDESLKAAQEYASAHSAKSKADAKLKTKKENLIAIMEEKGHERIPVQLGGVQKMVHHETTDKITFEVPKAE